MNNIFQLRYLFCFFILNIFYISCREDPEIERQEIAEYNAFKNRISGKWEILKVIFIHKNSQSLNHFKVDTLTNFVNHFYIFNNNQANPVLNNLDIQDTSFLNGNRKCEFGVMSSFDYLNYINIIISTEPEYKKVIGYCFFSNEDNDLKISYPQYVVYKNRSNIDSVYVEKNIYLKRKS